MSEDTEPNVRLPRWVWPVITVAAIVLGIILVNRFGPGAERREYYRLATRIEVHLTAIEQQLRVGSTPARDLQGVDRTRAEVAMAVNTALLNERFRREPGGTHRKLEALADRLDRTEAAELKTEIGCLQLVAELERDFPDAYDYIWFAQLRQYQDEKWIPRLSDVAPRTPSPGK